MALKRKVPAALLSAVAGLTTVLGVPSPARAETDPSYCTITIYVPGGWGCFIRDGDNWIASDEEGDGRHVEVAWQARRAGGTVYEAGWCKATYGLTVACYADYDKGDQVKFAVLVYDGSTLKRDSGWSSWIGVGA
jgi:hypothetical protein